MGFEMGNQNTTGLQASEQDNTEVTKAVNDPSEDCTMSNYGGNMKVSERVGSGDDSTNRSLGHPVIENDAGDKSQSTGIIGEEEEEKTMAVLNNLPDDDRAASIQSVDPETNEQEPVLEIWQELTAESIKEENRSRDEGILMESDAEERIEEDREQADLESDHSSTDFTPLQQECALPSDPISSTYLDAIDSEIKRLLEEDDQRVVDATSKTENDKYDGRPVESQTKHDEEIIEEESTAKDDEISSIEIPSKTINLKQEEHSGEDSGSEYLLIHNRDDNGSEYSLIDLLQTDEIRATENRRQDQHDYSLSSMSVKSSKDTECKKSLEKRSNTSSEDVFSEDKESSEMTTAESNQEKLNTENTATKDDSGNIEKLIFETAALALESQKENSGDTPLIIYNFERCVHEAEDQSPNIISEVEAEKAIQNTSPDHKTMMEVSYETTAIVLDSTKEESDTSPIRYDRSSGSSEVSILERTQSGKLKGPIISHLKEEFIVLETFEKKCITLTKTVEEGSSSPMKKVLVISAKRREKQKPRSYIFSNCMCCTTAIN